MRPCTNGKRISLAGSPSVPVDGFAVALIWATSLFALVALFAIEGVAGIAWLFAVGPVSTGTALMFAKMGESTWLSRVLAICYFGLTLLCLGLFLKHSHNGAGPDPYIPPHLRLEQSQGAAVTHR